MNGLDPRTSLSWTSVFASYRSSPRCSAYIILLSCPLPQVLSGQGLATDEDLRLTAQVGS